MMKASVAMDRYMSKLDDGSLKKENQPNSGPELTDEFIEEKAQAYTALLQSGLVEAAMYLSE